MDSKVFGALSVGIGALGLYFAWKRSNQPEQIVQLPALADSPSYAPGQPTSNGASIPAFYASPFEIQPNLIQQATGQPTQIPYQQVNMPPSHVERKQRAQQADISSGATSVPATAQSCGCGCDGSSKAKCDPYGTRTSVSNGTLVNAVKNIRGVGLNPVFPSRPVPQQVYSSTTAYNLATQTTVPIVNRLSNGGTTLVGNVPNVTDMIQ
jgi:hypothetical protein